MASESTDVREELISELRAAPERVVEETLDFVRFVTARARADKFATAIASETVLKRDWDTPEEDAAWIGL